MISERIALLGASRGLGAAAAERVQKQLKCEVLVISRKSSVSFDFSRSETWLKLISHLKEWQPTRIWYFAAGGPYGHFSDKEWKDHEWAWRVSFLCPAFLLHSSELVPQQWIAVGSAIAENRPDPMAGSYCAAKHALRGLITTLQAESAKPDLRLFSPGYMDTDLLPPQALPRQKELVSPSLVAQQFVDWALDEKNRNQNLILT